MKTIEEEFPPEDEIDVWSHMTELYVALRARAAEMERERATHRQMLTRADNLILRAIVMADGWADAEQWHNDAVDLDNLPLPPAPEIHQQPQ